MGYEGAARVKAMLKRIVCWLRGHHRYIVPDWYCVRPDLFGHVYCFRCGKTWELHCGAKKPPNA